MDRSLVGEVNHCFDVYLSNLRNTIRKELDSDTADRIERLLTEELNRFHVSVTNLIIAHINSCP